MTVDEKYMLRCIQLAEEAKRSGKTPVGSLIVYHDEIIAEAMEGEAELPQIMSHAENLAIIKATKKLNTNDLSECSLYTTVEPCFMCAYLIRQTRIKEVVYGTTTGAGGHSSAYPILTAADIQPWKSNPKVTGGVLRAECEQLFDK